MSVFTQTLRITPEIAGDLLAMNKGNRPLNEAHVRFFQRQILEGAFAHTHQGIAISESGRLLDGQHRLAAIQKAGAPVTMQVSYGLSDDSFVTMDNGLKRRAADALATSGALNATMLAAGIRLFIPYMAMPALSWSGGQIGNLCTPAKVREEYLAHRETWDEAVSYSHVGGLKRVIRHSVVTAFSALCLFGGLSTRKTLGRFVKAMADGVGLEEGSPILAYRRFAITSDSRTAQAELADYIKTWNQYCEGRFVKLFKTQPCPEKRGLGKTGPMPLIMPHPSMDDSE